ncbi:MAG: peptide/nickel transport system ATP-binding protein ddpF, partial [Solirubrobacteraceae bacterium]|nr:peptide/nickel transport system ATP-binding protein ddpF [Solirubrobacteraceae bacterium]
HDLDVAAQLAERIVVLYGGRVMEDGPTQQILRAPRHPYTAALLRSRLDLEAERRRPLVTLSGEPPDPEQLGSGCPFAPRCAFVQDACRAGEPPPATPVTGGRVACIRVNEIDPLAGGSQALPAFDAGAVASDVAPGVLRAHDLHVRMRRRGLRGRQDTAILRGVDLEVARGEAVALVGESGCGKTTLLRAAAGILTADGGELSRDGAVQMVFQDAGASLTPWLTIGEQVEDRLRDQVADGAERRARVSEALTMVGLPEAVGRARPRELSGGQRQRVAIARAIVVPPALLLCDEPTSALDVSVAAVVLNMLGRLRRELDMALLFVTHDLAVARLVADRIAVMYLGRIVEQGPADDVVRQPGHPYTRALLASITDPEMAAELSAGEPPSIFEPPSGCAFHTRCPVALESCPIQAPPWLAVGGDERRHVACVHGGELP